MPPNWHAPRAWLAQAVCIHEHEGAWNDPWSPYEGGLQFLLSTWTRPGVDGPVVRDSKGRVVHWASAFSPREQLYRAWLVWKQDGGSWREWGTAGACGLR